MTRRKQKIEVQGTEITVSINDQQDFISITDIEKLKNTEAPVYIIKNLMCRKNTIAWLGLWKHLNNPFFKLVEFNQFRNELSKINIYKNE